MDIMFCSSGGNRENRRYAWSTEQELVDRSFIVFPSACNTVWHVSSKKEAKMRACIRLWISAGPGIHNQTVDWPRNQISLIVGLEGSPVGN